MSLVFKEKQPEHDCSDCLHRYIFLFLPLEEFIDQRCIIAFYDQMVIADRSGQEIVHRFVQFQSDLGTAQIVQAKIL